MQIVTSWLSALRGGINIQTITHTLRTNWGYTDFNVQGPRGSEFSNHIIKSGNKWSKEYRTFVEKRHTKKRAQVE